MGFRIKCSPLEHLRAFSEFVNDTTVCSYQTPLANRGFIANILQRLLT